MIQELLAHDSPVAIIRSLGVYNISFNGKEGFPILVLDGAMGDCGKYIGAAATLNDSLEIAVQYVEHVAKHGAYPESGIAWEPRTTVSK